MLGKVIVANDAVMGNQPSYVAAAPPLYRVTDLGDLPSGIERSEAFAINDSGQIVGRGCSDIGSSRAVLRGNDGSITDLGDLPDGRTNTWAFDINNSGQIVGRSTILSL